MRLTIEIQDDINAAKRRRVNALRAKDAVAYARACYDLQALENELSRLFVDLNTVCPISNRKAKAMRKTITKQVKTNQTEVSGQPEIVAPRIRSSFDSVAIGKTAGAIVQMRGAKHSKAYTGSRAVNRLERSPVEGRSKAEQGSQARLKSNAGYFESEYQKPTETIFTTKGFRGTKRR